MNKCLECNKETSNVKYCSRSCSVARNNRSTKTKTGQYSAGKLCSECKSKSVESGRKYCGPDCRVAGMATQRLNDWLAGKVAYESEYDIPPFVRNFLLEESKHKCSSSTCAVPGGWGEIHPLTGKTPLQIDHIDGSAKNNARENLRVLCPNCHALTSNYGALNKGSGRKYRYKNKSNR